MEPRKQAILDALDRFVAQRSGIEFGNYGDVKSFRAEQRSITKDLRHYRTLRVAVASCDSLTADTLLEASRHAFSGRLTIHHCPHGNKAKVTCGANPKHVWCEDCDGTHGPLCHWCHGRGYSDAKPGATRIEYCTGQYFPTEYRRAACAVLASALWDWTREHAMPAHADPQSDYDREHGHQTYDGTWQSAGDWLRLHFRKTFGRSIAASWFN